MNMKELETIKELNTQYKILRNNGLVGAIDIRANIGKYSVKNKTIINKILDLLILESQKQIEREVNK